MICLCPAWDYTVSISISPDLTSPSCYVWLANLIFPSVSCLCFFPDHSSYLCKPHLLYLQLHPFQDQVFRTASILVTNMHEIQPKSRLNVFYSKCLAFIILDFVHWNQASQCFSFHRKSLKEKRKSLHTIRTSLVRQQRTVTGDRSLYF